MTKSVDDLVAVLAAEFAGHPRSGCWAANLEGQSAEFLTKIKEVESTGRKIRREVVIATLKEHFDVNIGIDALRRHLLGNCSCG